jgi:hypothetical protein
MTSLLLSERAPPNWVLHPELATTVDRRGTSAEGAQKGRQPRRQLRPQPGPCPPCKGNHWRSKCPPSPDERQGATSYGLMGPGFLSTLHFLASMSRSLGVAIMAEKQKIIFWLNSGAHFSVLPFSPSPWSNTRLSFGAILPRALFYPASGLPFGRPPLLSPFPHSSWNSSVPAGMGFTISTKSSNSPSPRRLSLPPRPSGTKRSHSVDWWDECRVSQDSPPCSNKAQKSLTVSTPKMISPQAWQMMRPYAYHKFLKKTKGY